MPEITDTPETQPEPKTIIDIVLDLCNRVEALEKRVEGVKDETITHIRKALAEGIRQHIGNV